MYNYYRYTDTIIDSLVGSFCTHVLFEKDLDDEYFKYGKHETAFLKHKFKDNKEELKEMLDHYFESGEAEDDLICGNGEFWRQEYDIFNIEDEMMGNEYELAYEKLRKLLEI